ncbi:MAG: L-2-hydroxyglutarate oxidase, partial [Planctomycetota bacterium]
MTAETHDLAVVGAGIVGLAVARAAALPPDEGGLGARVVVLEKEDRVAAHQTGHNSGVLHSGIYYKPGSAKALNCRRGKALMEAFCAEHGVAYELCGKVIVATDEDEVPRMMNIFERGQQNGVACEVVGKERLAELEPHANGVQAIHVPESGIVDYVGVCERLAEQVRERDGEVRFGAEVQRLEERPGGVRIETRAGDVHARAAVNCGGLHSDRVLTRSGAKRPARIVPFRGEYFDLVPSARSLCRNLIYPVPDPAFPFLGVHFTRAVNGTVECGPNAVLAFAREGYRKRDVNPRDLFDALTYPGFLKLAARHWRMGSGEMWRSVSKRAFVRALQKLVPEISVDALERAPAGVRAQALGRDGALVDDFFFEDSARIVHVLNAPSPAATASLAIAESVVER